MTKELLLVEPIKQEMIGSVYTDEQKLLSAILTVHNNGEPIDLDPMYSIGHFYLKIQKPKLRFDINPQSSDSKQANATDLPLDSNTIKTIILDPPFCFGIHGQTENNISAKRFTIIPTFKDLQNLYIGILKEAYRVLKSNGLLIFKCQDYTDSKTTMTHCLVYQWAVAIGFYAKDIAILENKLRIYNSNLTQRHLRKTHSYFWVFQKANNFSVCKK